MKTLYLPRDFVPRPPDEPHPQIMDPPLGLVTLFEKKGVAQHTSVDSIGSRARTKYASVNKNILIQIRETSR